MDVTIIIMIMIIIIINTALIAKLMMVVSFIMGPSSTSQAMGREGEESLGFANYAVRSLRDVRVSLSDDG